MQETNELTKQVAFDLALAATDALRPFLRPPAEAEANDAPREVCPQAAAAEALVRALRETGLAALIGANTLLVEAMTSANRLRSGRLNAATTAATLADAERLLKVEEARAEARVVEATEDGEKGLGPNAEARKRALAISVADDEGYRAALDLVNRAYFAHKAADADAEAEANRLSVLKAALRRNGVEV